uniref:Uncharacterized protein n=2 Tax=Oryza TaxID=4527 RepID=Q69SV2_ORYSJ|nr:hypothetical protein [Oryza sativa Japonica Group]BAD33294.1 hypothetical protein [Oryza sativa Japonica Group]
MPLHDLHSRLSRWPTPFRLSLSSGSPQAPWRDHLRAGHGVTSASASGSVASAATRDSANAEGLRPSWLSVSALSHGSVTSAATPNSYAVDVATSRGSPPPPPPPQEEAHFARSTRGKLGGKCGIDCFGAKKMMESGPVVAADRVWRDAYGVSTEKWTTKVEIKVKNVSEHANHPSKMETLVSSFCDPQAYRFDAAKNEHYVCGFAKSVESIPRSIYLKLKYETVDVVCMKSFLVNLEARLYTEAEGDIGAEEPDPEMYEDPDVVREAFEMQARLQRIAAVVEEGKHAGGKKV